MTNRKNKPISVTLSPEAIEAIDILKKEMGSKITSNVVDTSIKNEMERRGFSKLMPDSDIFAELEQEKDMFVEIISEGNTLPLHKSGSKNYIEAFAGSNYTIKITNSYWKRRLFVISIDGINILDGEDASVSGPGYVVGPYQSIEINGWRRTNEETAAFTFEPLKETYSVKVGKGKENIGVIGIASFDEKDYYTYWVGLSNTYGISSPMIGQNSYTAGRDEFISQDLFRTESSSGVRGTMANAAGSISNSVKELNAKKLGTGYGEKLNMSTREVNFERASKTPLNTMTYIYATREALVKMGVIVEEPIEPNPFPADKVAVKAPPGWKG